MNLKETMMQKIEEYFNENSSEQIERDLVDSGYYKYINDPHKYFIDGHLKYFIYSNDFEFTVNTYTFATSQKFNSYTSYNIKYNAVQNFNILFNEQTLFSNNENYSLAA